MLSVDFDISELSEKSCGCCHYFGFYSLSNELFDIESNTSAFIPNLKI